MLTFDIKSSEGIQSSCALYPSAVSSDSTAVKLDRLPLMLQGCLPGAYYISVAVTGRDASNYNLIFSVGNSFSLISPLSIAPAPRMILAEFTPDLHSVEVRFDSATNVGNTGFSVFPCSSMFLLRENARLSCLWKSPSSLHIINDVSSTVLPGTRPEDPFTLTSITLTVHLPSNPAGGTITLLNNTLSSALGNTTIPSYAVSHRIAIGMPAKPRQPVIALGAPMTLGSCHDAIIDFSMSSGSCGRGWKNVSFSVQTSDDKNFTLFDITERFLPQSDYLANDAIVIPFRTRLIKVTELTRTFIC